MMKINKNKAVWLKTFLILALFALGIFLISQLLILARPKPLRFYLEFLDRTAQRGQSVTVYTRNEFAKKYLGEAAPSISSQDFFKLFRAHFNNPTVKENSLFQIYKIKNSDDPCQIDIFGISKKRDLIYVSATNICLKNAQEIK